MIKVLVIPNDVGAQHGIEMITLEADGITVGRGSMVFRRDGVDQPFMIDVTQIQSAILSFEQLEEVVEDEADTGTGG